MLHSNDFMKLKSVPLLVVRSKDASSSKVLEDCVIWLDLVSKNLEGVTNVVTVKIGFWTQNGEGTKKVCAGSIKILYAIVAGHIDKAR